MECRRCLLTDRESQIIDGVCDFCRMHDELSGLNEAWLENLVGKLRGKKGYQVLIGISGGLDSSYLLWFTVKVLKLKPLVIHFNNRWNDPIAVHNMALLIDKLGVDFRQYTSDDEYDRLCGAFLKAGVKDLDIPNDVYMTELMRRVAVETGVKYGFNGHDFRSEGSTPLGWTYMDAKYIRSVYKRYAGRKLKTFLNYTFWNQIKSAFAGIRQIRVFHYFNVPDSDKRNTMLDFGWMDYGEKHGENIYTKFVGYYMLPKRWGIDKRVVYLSAQIRDKRITKGQARLQLRLPVEVDESCFSSIYARTGASVTEALVAPKQTYKDFDHYKFKRWKPLLWVMMKLKLTSYHFYKKYTK